MKIGTAQLQPLAAAKDIRATFIAFARSPDAKWSDGSPLTAQDCVDSWKRILTPTLAADYAYFLYLLRGAEAFNKGTSTDFSTVGVEVVDDDTLRLTLRGPTPYFREVLKHYTWTAVPRHVVLKYGSIGQRGNPWTRPENIVVNGGAFGLQTTNALTFPVSATGMAGMERIIVNGGTSQIKGPEWVQAMRATAAPAPATAPAVVAPPPAPATPMTEANRMFGRN